MLDVTEAQRFLLELSPCLESREEAEKVCRAGRRNEDILVKVIAAAVGQILLEIRVYLLYYEEDISKGFGVPVAVEWRRVYGSVFEHCQQKLASLPQESVDRERWLSEAIDAVADLIDQWHSFDREDVDRILASYSEN